MPARPVPLASRPRIGINAQLLSRSGTYRAAGIASYIRRLLERLPPAAPDLEFDVFAGEPPAPTLAPNLRWHTTRWPTHSPPVRILWEQLVQPVLSARHHLSLLHSMAFVQPWTGARNSVVTVYDLSFLFFPELFRPLNRLYLRWGTRHSVRHAARVIAISENTRRDLIRVYGLAPDRVTVVPCGVEERFCPQPDSPEESAALKARFGLPDAFILYLGTLEPRKNVPRLIRAFGQARRRAGFSQKLVLAGARGWYDESIDRAIVASRLEGEVILTGFFPAADLPALYRAARAFVFPSLYEGFGLPPLEALACGTPVITSRAGSLPEVAGEAGRLIDPESEDELAEAMVEVLSNAELSAELRRRGPAQAARFSWSRSAALTAETYRIVLAGNSK